MVWNWGLALPQVTPDIEATLVEVESENKEKAAHNYKNGFGYHPLLVHLDQTGEALGAMLQPGNAGSKTAQAYSAGWGPGPAAPAHPPAGPQLGMEVRVRSDPAGANHGFVDAIVSRGLESSVGFDDPGAGAGGSPEAPSRGLGTGPHHGDGGA